IKLSSATNTKPNFKPQFCTHPTEQLPLEVYLEHLIQYEIPYEELVKQGLKYVRDRNALYMPLYNPWQFRVGEQLKHLDKDTKPKNLIFKNIDEPLVHFPKTLSLTDYGELVLVEDWISAEKVHEIQPCASLQ